MNRIKPIVYLAVCLLLLAGCNGTENNDPLIIQETYAAPTISPLMESIITGTPVAATPDLSEPTPSSSVMLLIEPPFDESVQFTDTVELSVPFDVTVTTPGRIISIPFNVDGGDDMSETNGDIRFSVTRNEVTSFGVEPLNGAQLLPTGFSDPTFARCAESLPAASTVALGDLSVGIGGCVITSQGHLGSFVVESVGIDAEANRASLLLTVTTWGQTVPQTAGS